MQSVHYLCLLLLAGLVLAGCNDDPVGPEPAPQIELTRQQQQLIAADNQFGLHLFRALQEAEGDQNLIVSPLSVSMALGMTLNGARGDTRAAMEETLALQGLSTDEINTSYRSLIDLLTTLDPTVRLDLANSIWLREGFPVEEPFLEAGRTFFDAEVTALDFNRSEAPATINQWVRNATNGRIEDIVQPPIDPLTMLFLINAVYFRGDWTYPFDEDDTHDDVFTRPDGSTVPVQMMTMPDAVLPYVAGDGFQVVDLPYGDSLFSMTILLPTENRTLDDLVTDLTPERWADWTQRFSPVRFSSFEMPKFKLAYEATLNETLRAMGMDIAFIPDQADFGGINPERTDLHISKVKHKTFVEVDEKGTEAAAATSVEVGLVSLPPALRIDRPFVFAIREQATGTILFIGQVTDL